MNNLRAATDHKPHEEDMPAAEATEFEAPEVDAPEDDPSQSLVVTDDSTIILQQSENMKAAREAYRKAAHMCKLNPGLFSDMYANMKQRGQCAGAATLILCDWPYRPLEEPGEQDRLKLRQAIDYFSSAGRGAVCITWCNPFSVGKVRDMFRVTCGSQDMPGHWKVDPSLLTMVRHPSRAYQPRGTRMLRNFTEIAVVAYRKVRVSAGRWQLSHTSNSNNVHMLFGGQGLPRSGNVVTDYVPPTRHQRLKDCNGRVWRPFGEKSVKLYMSLLAKYTKPGDFVVDMFGGTFASAIACLALERKFLGCEAVASLTRDAQLRIGRYLLHTQATKGTSGTRALEWASSNALASMLSRPPSDPILGADNAPDRPAPMASWRTAHQVYVKESQLVGAQGRSVGKGLFAATTFSEGQTIAMLWGDWLPPSDALPEHKLGYVRTFNPISTGFLIRVRDECPGGYVNDPKETGKKPNVRMEEGTDEEWQLMEDNGSNLVRWVATREIAPDEEILGSYGPTFWNEAEGPVEAGVLQVDGQVALLDDDDMEEFAMMDDDDDDDDDEDIDGDTLALQYASDADADDAKENDVVTVVTRPSVKRAGVKRSHQKSKQGKKAETQSAAKKAKKAATQLATKKATTQSAAKKAATEAKKAKVKQYIHIYIYIYIYIYI